ncbi:MAG: hypothetical protein Q4D26_10355 [Clostridia bacterium]|nr:hypothetical protein [Clostridia bacterium]
MNFKEALENDLKTVFHNNSEFAENVTIYYDGQEYENIPAVIDKSSKERKKDDDDKELILYTVDVTVYINMSDLGFIPKKNHNIFINDDEFKIVTSKEEIGEIVLELEALDE